MAGRGFGFGGGRSNIPAAVQPFLIDFVKNVAIGSTDGIWRSYRAFKAITGKTYKVSSWPSVDAVMQSLKLNANMHENFYLLYNELYYRHLFDRCETDNYFMDLCDAFQNYINLFNKMLEPQSRFPEIPESWLWEMINSFVSQFQYYHHWKNKGDNVSRLLDYRGTDQQEYIQEKWTVQAVLRYLHALVMAAQIRLQYNPPVEDDGMKNEEISPTLRYLGWFSLIGLSRMHCLTGDYRTSIKVLDLVDLRKKSAVSRIENCHISAHYYLALSYLMTKRWSDCHNICVSVLARYPLNEGFLNVDDRISKKELKEEDLTDKDIYHYSYLDRESMLLRCYALLAIAHALNNKTQKLETLMYETIKDMFGRQWNEMSNENRYLLDMYNKNKSKEEKKSGDVGSDESSLKAKRKAFKELFLLACPDYPNSFDLFVDTEASKIDSYQLKVKQFDKFFRLVNLSKSYEITKMREELKLYQAIPTAKLAKELNFSDSSSFQKELIQLKSKMRQYKRVDGVSSNGEWSNISDFDFFVKQDDVNVRRVDGTRLGRYTDMFVNNIRHVKELIENANPQ